MPAPDVTRDDLRAAVASGILTEPQAASLSALIARRQAGLPAPDDEPFELISGFAEIFISVGLVILLAGFAGLALMLGMPVAMAVVGMVICAALASYFTLRRRMVLPSIVLVIGFALSVAPLVAYLVLDLLGLSTAIRHGALISSLVTMVALLGWYRVFRLPFTMFLVGLAGLAVVLALSGLLDPSLLDYRQSWRNLFDLRHGSGLAMGTLIFGVAAAVAGLWFDMRDPHRIGRASASAFWLHLLAAPAIVNTLGLTAMTLNGAAQSLAVAATLAVMTVFALVIDRRSFLTAGLGYLAWLIWSLSYQSGQGLDWPVVLILIGGAVTALGAWWIPLRSALMRALPGFPGKDRLPPYAKGTQ